MEKIQYSFKKGLGKTVINLVIFLGPIVISGILDGLPESWDQMTVSGAISSILYMVVNYAKVKAKEDNPPLPM